MGKLNEIKGRLNGADEMLQDLRCEMEGNIIDYMRASGVTSIELGVIHNCEEHNVVITLVDNEEETHIHFEDKREGWDDYTVYDMALSTDLIASVCMELSDM